MTPKYEFGTAQSFFSSIEKQIAPDSPVWNYQSIAKGYTPPPAVAGKVNIPTWESELYFEYHRGVMTTQANHKRNMRDGEEEMLNAEKLSSLAWLYGAKYPGAELTEDWKKVLFNQFHDLAAGSGIGGDLQGCAEGLRRGCGWSTDGIDAKALQAVAEIGIDTRRRGRLKGDSGRGLQSAWVGDAAATSTVIRRGSDRKVRAFPGLIDEKCKDGQQTAQSLERDAAISVVRVNICADVSVPALGYRVIYQIPRNRRE